MITAKQLTKVKSLGNSFKRQTFNKIIKTLAIVCYMVMVIRDIITLTRLKRDKKRYRYQRYQNFVFLSRRLFRLSISLSSSVLQDKLTKQDVLFTNMNHQRTESILKSIFNGSPNVYKCGQSTLFRDKFR